MSDIVRFDCFEADLEARRLLKRGRRLRLAPQSFQVLAMLLEHPGQLVHREELQQRLWPGQTYGDFDNHLNTAVARLRQALDDRSAHPRFVETLPKEGYRFIAPLLDPALRRPVDPALGRRPRVLVLPFLNLTGDPALDYVSDGLTEELITDLAAVAAERLAVIARTTALRYKGSRKDIGSIDRELQVQYVVEGSVRGDGSGLTVNAQLVRSEDQTHVWARQYRAGQPEVFRFAARAARAIAEALGAGGARQARSPAGAGRLSTRDPAAYREYLQGRYCFDRLKGLFEGCRDGRAHFERAVARDPNFAPAHEGLAELHWFLGYTGVTPPREAFGDGLLHAVRALQIDNERAETRAILAQYYKQLDYRWPDTERELTKALAASPSSPFVRMHYAVGWLMPQGRIREAIAELQSALEWDPLSYHPRCWLAIMLALAREWDRSLEQARLLIELEPDPAIGYWAQGFALRGKGLVAESIASHARAAGISGGAGLTLGWLGLVLGAAGRLDEARAVLGQLEADREHRYVPPSSLAWVHLGLRDVDRAFEWMERAVDAHDQLMMPIKSYAFLDPIRRDPRFAALLRKMKLEA
jgi:TolB-like protein/DNA-binding winged helix-turn-helix (wHTH) protein